MNAGTKDEAMRQGWLFGIACGAGAALLLGLASFAPILALLIYAVPLGPLLAGLIAGVGAALAAALAFLVVAILFAPTSGIILFAALALPAALLARQALLRRGGQAGSNAATGSDWSTAGQLLGGVVFGGMLVAIAAQIAIGSQEEEARAFLMAQMAGLAEPGPGGQSQLSRDDLAALVAGSLRAAPLGVAMVWVLVMTVNGVVAQAIATSLRRNLRPSPAYGRVRVPGWVLYAIGASLLLGFVAPEPMGRIGTIVGIVLAMAYLMQGLAVVHAFARRTGGGRWLLAPFYVLLLVIGPLMPFAVVLLGLIEDHARYRDRKRGPVGKEEE